MILCSKSHLLYVSIRHVKFYCNLQLAKDSHNFISEHFFGYNTHIDKVLMKYWVIPKAASKWNYECLWPITDCNKILRNVSWHVTVSICNIKSLGSNRFTLKLWTLYRTPKSASSYWQCIDSFVALCAHRKNRSELQSKSIRPRWFFVTNRFHYMSEKFKKNFITIWDFP